MSVQTLFMETTTMPADKILFFIIIYGVGAAVLFFVSHTLIEAGAKIGDRGK